MSGKVRALVTLLAAALASCTLTPAYHRPTPAIPAAYAEAHAEAQAPHGPSAAAVGWRDFFCDPHLQALIDQALQNNQDLRLAALNVQKAQAQYRITRAASLPQIEADGAASSSRTPLALSAPGSAAVNRDYSVSVGLSGYEVDLFGRLRSLNAQSLQSFLASEEGRDSVQISLIAQVASAYLTLAADQDLLAVAARELESQSESVDLIAHEAARGLVSDLALRQAQVQREMARVALSQSRAQVAQDLNALTLLLGAAPKSDALPQSLADYTALLPGQEALPAGLPSELITARPDIKEAERELQAANANIGAARAAFFPRITLTASDGTESASLSGLFGAGSGAWTFAPQVTLPIFAAGKNRANLAAAEVGRDIAVATYQKTIQSAFREVSDALIVRQEITIQISAEEAELQAAREAYRLALLRFNHGADDYLSVLEAQRSAYSAQTSLVNLYESKASNLVTLYKSLGGGVNEHSPVLLGKSR